MHKTLWHIFKCRAMPPYKVHTFVVEVEKKTYFYQTNNVFKAGYYEGRSICNENSPVYPKVL